MDPWRRLTNLGPGARVPQGRGTLRDSGYMGVELQGVMQCKPGSWWPIGLNRLGVIKPLKPIHCKGSPSTSNFVLSEPNGKEHGTGNGNRHSGFYRVLRWKRDSEFMWDF